ncbi:MAG: hypothetical protein LBQ26_00525 [Holosporales bacterium]|jgi:hypothetical protein|nr:hypothetical protein [Holosporales bacterium]
MKRVLSAVLMCYLNTAAMGAMGCGIPTSDHAIAYDTQGHQSQIDLLDVTVEDPSIRRLDVYGTISVSSWKSLSRYPNLVELSLEHVDRSSFACPENWVVFFEAIQKLPIEKLNLAHQLLCDSHLCFIPESVKYLDISHTNVLEKAAINYLKNSNAAVVHRIMGPSKNDFTVDK